MVDTILPVILSISSLVAVFIGAFISVRSVKKRREIEVQLFNEIINQQIKQTKNKRKKALENSIIEIENELKRRVDILNKMQMDLEAVSENKRDFDKSKYLRNVKYDKYLLEINEAMKNIDSKNRRLLDSALNQGSEIGKVRYLEKITKEALEKTVG
ncbi:TPA: hypothetical protein ACP6W3_004856 [Escherichia coli]|uniref:hypothetical protein n=1 Tax=Escherichia coli TaxID=562 RepID=UPI001A042128|nr:hypothetical protein [Escherichia coli]EJN7982389.1 hypothetical protein [Escherichia coli]